MADVVISIGVSVSGDVGTDDIEGVLEGLRRQAQAPSGGVDPGTVSGTDPSSDISAISAFDELVLKVRTAGRPCMRCALNAQKDKPDMPQLHMGCKCKAHWERRDGSIMDVLR